MSLDLAVLDDKGGPLHEVPVSAVSHSELMRQAEALNLHQLLRMGDFYRDVDYTAQETQRLQQETKELAAKCSGNPELCTLIGHLEGLMNFAVNNNKSVVAIAD